jgi:general secretion pathway protein D
MQDTVTESEDRVPVLGAIPLIGNLFKSRSGSRQKSNLLVFLRPKILRDQIATEATSTQRYNEIRDEQKSLHKGKITLLPGEKQPSIPAIQGSGDSATSPTIIVPAPQPAAPTQVAPAPQPAPTAQPNTTTKLIVPSPPRAAAPQPAATPQPALAPQPTGTP